jgi:hypothetical protein
MIVSPSRIECFQSKCIFILKGFVDWHKPKSKIIRIHSRWKNLSVFLTFLFHNEYLRLLMVCEMMLVPLFEHLPRYISFHGHERMFSAVDYFGWSLMLIESKRIDPDCLNIHLIRVTTKENKIYKTQLIELRYNFDTYWIGTRLI